MTTIDLGTPPPPATTLLEGLPRRVALTLPELQYCAASAGDAPLPFVLDDAVGAPDPLADRLGGTTTDSDGSVYADALASLHDPVESLTRRGLIGADGVDAGVLGAIGLLATPDLGLDIDVTAAGIRAKSWHRQAGGAVATLATVDGIVFELAWFGTESWPDDLGRVAGIPEDVPLSASALPEVVNLPYELVDAAGEALRTHRLDVLPVLVAQHSGRVLDADARPLRDQEVLELLQALHSEGQGRIRAMLADVAADATTVGVVSWLLLADGWHSLRPHSDGDEHRVEVRRVEPSDFASAIAPVLAEVTA